jgi:hypothetical protein
MGRLWRSGRRVTPNRISTEHPQLKRKSRENRGFFLRRRDLRRLAVGLIRGGRNAPGCTRFHRIGPGWCNARCNESRFQRGVKVVHPEVGVLLHRDLDAGVTGQLLDGLGVNPGLLHAVDERQSPARLVIADRPCRSLGSRVVRPCRSSARAATPRPKLLRAVLGVITVRRFLRSMQCLAPLAAPATASSPGREPPSLIRRESRLRMSVRLFVGHDDRDPVLEPPGIEDRSP